ncbi:ChaN family lipoprotein [Sansalvadorimonas verongulae]|uniref:ChaN family lipoprotein n=1 Tax=Sansalvadorimonas verongulae TaxID=2172824 RepID=UPI0012BC37FE|nr:ChaN family lipoprotein [Sansalvadorimonas verongulae]MTI13619.1 hypothetical protein [Sansalvadorimonas verongulae]
MNARKVGVLLSAALLSLAAGCAHTQLPQSKDTMPVYNTATVDGTAINGSVDALVDELVKSDYIILGERHDNPEHHNLQLEILKELHKRGWLKQVSMEMITPSQQADVDMAIERKIDDFYGLEQVLQWQKGWDWNLYGPIVSWVVSEGIPLQAANLDENELKSVREKPNRVGTELLGPEGLAIHRQQFRDSHCGYVDRPREESMLRVQLSRDARMASSMTARKKGVVLLAGSWHARKDIGVPRFVKGAAPYAKLTSLGMVERTGNEGENLENKYDIVWMTDGVERPDYCEMFRSRMKKP